MKNKSLLVFAICVISVNSLFGQLVNVESLRYNRKDGWQGIFSLSANINQSTKNILQAKTNLSFQYTTKAHTFMSFSDFGLMRVDKETALINNGFQHFRYNYTVPFLNRIVLEYFVQYQYNLVKLLRTRFITGLGPRIGILKKEQIQLYFSPLLMYEYELLTDNTTETGLIKWDAIIAFNYIITDKIKFGMVTYYQPGIFDYKDYRISSDSYLEFKVASNLSFQSVFNFSYDSQPPATINSLFYNFSNVIKITF